MKRRANRRYAGGAVVLALVAVCVVLASLARAADDNFVNGEWAGEELAQPRVDQQALADPLEPLNRVFFTFNDRLYFWVLKPVATGYRAVIPDPVVRTCFSNAFYNLLGPVRVVNNLLQGKIKGAGTELAALVINSTLGIAGLADPAHKEFGLARSEEDLGQTLGRYGVGNGFYICWPILGPSTLRDTVGLAGDAFLSPLTYLTASDTTTGLAVEGGKKVNATSLAIGDYEQLKESSFDPYVALRNAYAQSRDARVQDTAEWPIRGVAAAETAPAPAIKAGKDFAPPPAGYYVRVGVYVDPTNTEQQRQRLAEVGKTAVVTRYARTDYFLYGVEVPGGADFATAKHTEAELDRRGFAETVVVRH